MTKQIVTSSESGACASANSELGVESFERLIKGFQSQFAGFRTEDTVLIGNCPQNVTDEEINKFFCGFATIIKLQRVVFKSLTTNVFIAKFDSTESASRSKVLNTLALNGKKILLLQPDEKHLFNRKNVVELNGLQEHSEEVIYDHMSTFGNVSFVLKTSTVTYIVFEELSAVESSCRCDYLDQYPVTIRSVLDCSAAGTGAGGPGSSIETCILEQIDQNSGLLADEEEGQINNFMQLLDMENLDEYLEQDEKEKSTASDKPLLEVGNEEIIVTEDEAAQSEGDREADVAAIEKQALQLQQKKTAGTVLVDDRAKKILKLGGNLLHLSDLPQLSVAVRRVPNKVKIGPKKGSLPSKHGESKKKKSATKDSSVSKKGSEASSGKKQEKSASKPEASVEKKKTNKETVNDKEVSKGDVKDKEKEKSKKKHTKKQNPVPVTEETQKKLAESPAKEIKTEACATKSSEKKTDGEHEAEHKHSPGKKQKESKTAQESEKVKASDSKPGISESASKEANKEEKKTNIHQKCELLAGKKSVFVQLTKLTTQQIEELSQIRRKTVTSHGEVDGDDPKKGKEHGKKQEKSRKPGPAKGAMKEKQQVPVEKEAVKEKVKKTGKRVLSDDETEPSVPLVEKEDPKPSVTTPAKKPTKTDSTQKKKKPKLEDSSEKVHPEAESPKEKEQAKSTADEDKPTSSEDSKAQVDTEPKTSEIEQLKVEEPEAKPQQTSDEPVVLPDSTSEVAKSEPLDKISESVPDISNTVEIDQTEPAADAESDEERPLVMDISFDTTEEVIGKQSLEERKLDRKVVSLDSKSAALLKGKTHDGHLLFLDALPRVVVKLRHVTASDYKITRPKEEHTPKPPSEHHEKHPPKKVSFDSSAIKKREEKSEKPRKTNLDRIDSKFLPAGSKLKSKVKSKTEINHKKHLPVPELPIELKTHLNTSFKIPKKNSSVKPQSIDRNASELNCLHKDQDERDKQRKRFQKERRPPRDGPSGGRDKKQNRPDSSSNARQDREPSPVPDFFDPSFDDHSPSPQRIPPTPPPGSETSAAPPQTAQRDGNQRPPAKPRPNNKPSFNEIWNIPEKKPEVWAQPPWGSSAFDSSTLTSGDTWDSEPVQPLRERNVAITKPNVPRNTRESRSPVSRAPPQTRNTIDSGESWSPGGGGGGGAAPQGERQQPLPRKIDDGESWSPGTNKREQQQPQRDLGQDRRPPPQFSARRSRSPHQVQLSNTIGGGDMWDLDEPPVSARKLPSPKRPNINQNPLLCGGTWDEDELPAVTTSAPFDRRPSIEQRPLNRISPMRMPPEQRRRSRSPFRQRRSRSRSPAGRRRSMDRSPPNRRNRSADQSADRRNVGLSRSRDRRSQSPVDRRAPNRSLDRRNFERDQSPFGRRRRSRSRSPPRGSPPLRGFRPRRSCSPRPDLRSSSADIWDAGTSSRTPVAENSLLAGATWDDEIVPLRGPVDRSPPRLRDALQDHRRRYALDRLSPNGRRRSSSRDRLLPERRNQSFDRSPLREGGFNRRWSRDRSPPNRRKRSRSRSPGGWRRSMERSPVRRRRSVGDRSPSYQRMLDYWKAVEDMEGEMDPSLDRPNVDQLRRSQSPPERWSPRANDRGMARRPNAGRIDSETPWINEPEPRHRAMDDSQYSPSRAFDAISSDEECDFTNPRRATSKNLQKSPRPGRESFETIPLKIPSRSEPPIVKLEELPLAADSPLIDNEASRDSLGSVPSYKGDEPENEVPGTKEQPAEEAQVVAAEEKKSVLENLKQRAEKLKKLEEMKFARQKLLAQIKQKYAADKSQPSEVENSKLNTTPMPAQPSEKKDDDNQKHPDPAPCTPNRQVLVATSTVPVPANPLLSNVDSLLNKPPLPAPGIPVALPQIPPLPICPPLPFGMAPPIPPLPSEAPPPPPPDEPRPPEPVDFAPPPSNAWNPPPPPLAPIMAPIDVTKPPPNMANPLLNPMSSPRFEEEPFDDSANSFADNNVFNPQFPPSHFVDKFRRSQPNRGPNFNMPPDDNPFPVMPPEEHEFGNRRMPDFNAPINQQRHRDPRQQQQRQQNRFGGNKPFMRPQQQQQQQQQRRDPRQNHDGNVYGGGQLNNFNNNNPRNNFNNNNNNPRNNFNNNPRNNFNNNPRNNFNNNNNPGNNFNNNNPGNNFNNNNNFGNNFDNNPDNFFNNDDPDDNFGNMNPENSFNNNNNNNPGNFFAGNQRGRGVGGRGRFNNNNQQQQRFNFQQQNRNQPFNNNNNNSNRNDQHIMQQQQRFLMQQQEMFEEGCFDMNEFDCNDGGDGGGGGEEGANDWDDLM